MNILFVTPYLPDEHAGAAGAQLMWRIVTGLAKTHRIILISLTNPHDDPAPLSQHCSQVYTVPFARHYGRWSGAGMGLILRRLKALLLSILARRPYLLEKYHRKDVRRLISRVLEKEPVDLLQCEYNLMALNCPSSPSLPTLLVEHDVSMIQFDRMSALSRSFLLRLMARIQQRLWQRAEPQLCDRFHAIITLTQEDKDVLQAKGVGRPIHVVHPPVNVRPNLRMKKYERLCFVASYNRPPNTEALAEILYDLWPRIKEHRPNCRLHLAGKNLSGKLLSQAQSDSQVEYAGFVQDIDGFIANSSVMLAPIRLGGGLKMKVTHALACGTPVITTTVGAEGIDLGPAEGLFVVDDQHEMVALAIQLLSDPDRVARLSAAAAKAAQDRFSLQKTLATYEAVYAQLLNLT